jgi:hypothetical protein
MSTAAKEVSIIKICYQAMSSEKIAVIAAVVICGSCRFVTVLLFAGVSYKC